MLSHLTRIALLLVPCVLTPSVAQAQTCTYGAHDFTAPEVWKHQSCVIPTFTTVPLSFATAGTYPAQYLGKLQGGSLSNAASVTTTLLGASAGVTLANVSLSTTPPATASQGDTGQYLYGDITIANTATPGTLALLMNVAQGGVQVLAAVDALSIQRFPSSTCQQDVTSQLQITSTQPVRLFNTQLYTQIVTLKNTGSTTIVGPLLIGLSNLSTNAQLFAGNGTLSCGANTGAPFQYVGAALAAGASTRVVLTFTNSLVPQAAVVYQPVVLAGSRP